MSLSGNLRFRDEERFQSTVEKNTPGGMGAGLPKSLEMLPLAYRLFADPRKAQLFLGEEMYLAEVIRTRDLPLLTQAVVHTFKTNLMEQHRE